MTSLSIKKIIKPVFLTLFFVPTFYLVTTSYQIGPKKELKIGKSMPLSTVELENIKGGTTSLEKMMGENGILVVFSCNTCPFVVGNDNFEGWEKQYNEIDAYAKERGFSMVLVNSNEAKRENADSKDEMIKHAADKNYSMPYLIDKNSVIADAFGAKTTPHVYLFDEGKKLIYRGAIDNAVETDSDTTQTYLYCALNSASKGEKIEIKNTPPRGCSIKRK